MSHRRIPKLLSVAALLTLCTTHGCMAQTPQAENTRFAAQRPARPFYSGVYIYEYRMARAAQEQRQEYFAFLDSHLDILQRHGVNAIYLGGTSQTRFAQTLQLLEKHGMKLIPQLDFAYFQAKWTEAQLDENARVAGQFIAAYQDDPRILAWSVKEEVSPKDNTRLALYYSKILEYAPRAQFNTIDNNLAAAKDRTKPYPAIMGTDRYAFWWEFSGGGYLTSPASALSWTRTQAALYYAEAARRNADYMLVVTAQGMMMPALANRAMQSDGTMSFLPGTAEEHLQFRKRIDRFAQDGRMGWKKFISPSGEARYTVWKYYRPPVNCMKAMAWTSVLEGAKLFFVWSYWPPTQQDLSLDVKTTALDEKLPYELHLWTLAGHPGEPNSQLAEFGEANREIQAYEHIITRMTKLPALPIQSSQPGIYHNGFSLSGIQGQIVVLHNANVGSWPPDSGREYKDSDRVDDRNLAGSWRQFKDDDKIYIDDDGNLVGYVPLKTPLKFQFSLKNAPIGNQKVFDLRTGQEIIKTRGGYELAIEPGSGRLVFIGSGLEAQKLQQWVTPVK